MKLVSITILLFAASAAAQSGRLKPSPTPTPRSIAGPSVNSIPVVGAGSAKTAATPAAASGSESDEVIKVESVLVPIPVSVLDVNGRAVTTLKLTDFELKVDGRTVVIDELARSETPIRLAMLFDNSSSILLAREFEKKAAIRFFRRVIRPDKDRAALFSVADQTRLEQPFTTNISALIRAIEMFPEPKGTTALLDGIIEVADYLRAAAGRRVIVIVSDGEDTTSDYKTTFEDVIKALQVNDCQVYVVKTKEFENFIRTGVRGGNANIRALTAERRMIDITTQTGGAVYSPINENEMREAFERISAELSQQYILSYYPDGKADTSGDFRSIELSIKGKPNLTVRTRKGYYVPKR